MKKTLSLFQRNYHGDRLVRDELVPGAEWVAAGEGVATRKHDGTCCMWRDGVLWKRHELKAGNTAPAGFEAAQAPDSVTGDTPGWVPVGDGPVLADAPRTFVALRDYLQRHDIEGIVWHHPDGRMVKIKGKDFGLKRG